MNARVFFDNPYVTFDRKTNFIFFFLSIEHLKMIYRDRQGLSPSGHPIQSSNNRDRYLDNCFLLCIKS